MGQVFNAMTRTRRKASPLPPVQPLAPAVGDVPAPGMFRSASGPRPRRMPPPRHVMTAPPAPEARPTPVAAPTERSEPPQMFGVDERVQAPPARLVPMVADAPIEEVATPPREASDASAPGGTAGAPIVAPVPCPGAGQYRPEAIVHYDRGSVITEQYRAIRLQILARCRTRTLQTHVLTSSVLGEGKTLTSINLALAFAELQNQRTLLIEGDLRRPNFHEVIGQRLRPGLLQLLRGQIMDIDPAIHPTPYDNVHIMPAGDIGTTRSTELISSARFARILDQLKRRYDHIFIDSPPVISVTDACVYGSLCDETLLVVRLNKTPAEVVDRCKRLLRAADCEVAGVILTHMRHHIPKYLYRYV